MYSHAHSHTAQYTQIHTHTSTLYTYAHTHVQYALSLYTNTGLHTINTHALLILSCTGDPDLLLGGLGP